ncbi:hypothetical protein ACLMJK_004087 [Lecanora helva]
MALNEATSLQPLRNVLVVGASGNLAPIIIKTISNDPTFNLTVLSRDGSSSLASANTKLIRLPTPYQADALYSVLKGQDAIINMIPPFDLDAHKTVIDVAIKAGVKRYIPPEFSSRDDNPYVTTRVPFAAVKGNLVDLLVSKEQEGLSWTGVVCGGFLDWGIKVGFLGLEIANRKAVLYNNGTQRLDLTLLSDIARAVVGILKHPLETKNRRVNINTLFTSPSVILSVLEKQIGQTFDRQLKDADSANKEGREAVERGDMSGARDMMMGLMSGGAEEMVNGYGKDNDLLLGHGTRSDEYLEEIVRAVLQGADL